MLSHSLDCVSNCEMFSPVKPILSNHGSIQNVCVIQLMMIEVAYEVNLSDAGLLVSLCSLLVSLMSG